MSIYADYDSPIYTDDVKLQRVCLYLAELRSNPESVSSGGNSMSSGTTAKIAAAERFRDALRAAGVSFGTQQPTRVGVNLPPL